MAERKRRTYRIGQAAHLLDLEGYVLRFWETEFPQLSPKRTPKGQRIYTDADIELLRRIRALVHEEGMTLDGARRRLVSGIKAENTATTRPECIEQDALASVYLENPRSVSSQKESHCIEIVHKSQFPDAQPLPLEGSSSYSPPDAVSDLERVAMRELLASMEQELLALQDVLRRGCPPPVTGTE